MDFNSCLCCWILQKDIDLGESKTCHRRLHNIQSHKHDPKRNLEKSKFVEIMETKGFKIFVQHQNQMDSHGYSKQGGLRFF